MSVKAKSICFFNNKQGIVYDRLELFAPALKGVIDFGCAELARKRARFFAPFRVRAKRRKSRKICY